MDILCQRMLAVGEELIYLAKCLASPQVQATRSKDQTARVCVLKFLKENAPQAYSEGQVAHAINACPSTVRRCIGELVNQGKLVRTQARSKGKSALFRIASSPPSRNPLIETLGDGMTCDNCGKHGVHKISEIRVNDDLVEIFKCAFCGFSKRE